MSDMSFMRFPLHKAPTEILPAAARIKTEVGKDDPSAAAPMLLCFP